MGLLSRADLREKQREGVWRVEPWSEEGQAEPGMQKQSPWRGSCVFSKYSEKLVKYFKQRSGIILISICKNYFGSLCVENRLGSTYGKANMMDIFVSSLLQLDKGKPIFAIPTLACYLSGGEILAYEGIDLIEIYNWKMEK